MSIMMTTYNPPTKEKYLHLIIVALQLHSKRKSVNNICNNSSSSAYAFNFPLLVLLYWDLWRTYFLSALPNSIKISLWTENDTPIYRFGKDMLARRTASFPNASTFFLVKQYQLTSNCHSRPISLNAPPIFD